MTKNLARAAVIAQLIFVGGFLVAGAAEGHGYSALRHDISDLGALTSHTAVPFLICLAVSGLLTGAFALGSLRPALQVPGRPAPLGPFLLALSLPSLDNFGDVFFRLDCRAADAGCTAAASSSSWHGKMHFIVFLVALVPTLVAPFVLARRFALIDRFRALARPARVFGIAVIVLVVVTAASQGSSVQGLIQRVLATFVVAGIAALAWRVAAT